MAHLRFRPRTVLALIASFGLSASAEVPASGVAGALPLTKCEVSPRFDLGEWDEVVPQGGEGALLLRRGNTFYSLPSLDSTEPVALAQTPAAPESAVFRAVGTGADVWAIVNFEHAMPVAVNIASGQISRFQVPGFDEAAIIDSVEYIPTANAILVNMFGNTDARQVWPRKSHPVYFWMSLATGKVIAFPLEWALDGFSPDQSVAIFTAWNGTAGGRWETHAVQLATGQSTVAPNRYLKTGFAPYDWQDKDEIKTLYAPLPGKGDRPYFAGFSYYGQSLYFDLGLSEQHHKRQVDFRGGYLAFTARINEHPERFDSPLWVMAREDGAVPQKLLTRVDDFALLDDGNAVAVTTHEKRIPKLEAYYLGRSDKRVGNLLDGIPRLPPIEDRFRHRDNIHEGMSIDFKGGRGPGVRGRLALCRFHHFREDPLSNNEFGPHVHPRQSWNCALLVASNGDRFLLDPERFIIRDPDLLSAKSPPDKIWLSNSGRILLAHYIWLENEAGIRVRHVRLGALTVQWP